MPIVKFADDGATAEVAAGTTVQDVAEMADARHAFGCRDGMCGTCIVTVLEGMDALSPKGEEEADTLEAFDGGPDDRLACQLVVTGEPGANIVLKAKD